MTEKSWENLSCKRELFLSFVLKQQIEIFFCFLRHSSVSSVSYNYNNVLLNNYLTFENFEQNYIRFLATRIS